MHLKNGAVVALLGVLAACGPTVRDPAPGAVPVNVEAAATKFYEESPGSAAGLVDDRKRGFLINEDGKAFFVPFNAISDLRNRTGVSSMEGKFGNGATIRETLNLVAFPAV